MLLDATTLRVAFAISALTLVLLFSLVTYRETRSAYSLWWSMALALLMLGSSAYLFDGTSLQVFMNPLGNVLIVTGASSVWAAARSLRRLMPGPVQFALAPAVTLVASTLENPAVNEWSGGATLLASTAVMVALSCRELYLLEPTFTRIRWPLFWVSALLSVFYVGRTTVFLLQGPRGPVFESVFGTEVTTLLTMVLLVVVSFSMAGLSGEQITKDLGAQVERGDLELAQAAQVQRNLVPQSLPDLPGYEVAGVCVPSGGVSGDFFDWQPTADGLALTLADVMGKGVGAAMIAATVRAALRVALRSDDAETAVGIVESIVESDLTGNQAFVTMLHARLESGTGALTVVDAGHGFGVIVRADATIEVIPSDNLPIGVGGAQSLVVHRYILDVGDLLLVFSDGVLDLFDGTMDSLLTAAAYAGGAGPTAADAVDAIRRLARAGGFDDDVTLLAVLRLA